MDARLESLIILELDPDDWNKNCPFWLIIIINNSGRTYNYWTSKIIGFVITQVAEKAYLNSCLRYWYWAVSEAVVHLAALFVLFAP